MNYGIALGSNLGDRLHHLHQALTSLSKIHKAPATFLQSKVYLTQAVDCKEKTPPFYNMTIELQCSLTPFELLQQLRKIELELGRPTERERNASRTIDLDILYANDLVMNDAELTLPHPRLTQRRFVLQPLADIRPRLILPGQNKSIATLLVELKSGESPLETIDCPCLPELSQPAC